MTSLLPDETKYFYELTPDRILDAVESATGQRCTGRAMALNSMENRVYEIELELEDKPKHRADRFLIAKFYRPGRWTKAQIIEEHEFLLALVADEIPAVAPIHLLDGKTLHQMKGAEIFFALFKKVGGRSPSELDEDQLKIVGRLLARIHNVGHTIKATHRLQLSPVTYGLKNLEYLHKSGSIPMGIIRSYSQTVERICESSAGWFANAQVQLVHGDCHFGNLLWDEDRGPFWVDFDDCLISPPVQDLWLLVPGRDEYAKRAMQILLDAYEEMRQFDRNTLCLIEPLRALRLIRFSAWIARRWKDPAFKNAFPGFGSDRYWEEQLADLREQLAVIEEDVWQL